MGRISSMSAHKGWFTKIEAPVNKFTPIWSC
jgi:hypothetical protein